MNDRLWFVRLALVLSLLVAVSPLQAACVNPENIDEYYYPSLEQELQSSDAIVVGTIVDIENLSENPSDPGGWTAFLYTVRVTEVLLGQVAGIITLRAENDSGGYRVDSGTSHILFLNFRGEYYSADPCGNSSELPDGVAVVDEVKALLSK